MQVEFHPLFWDDVEAQAIYMHEQASIGDDFLDEVEKTVEVIKGRPQAYAFLYGSTRHLILKKFNQHVIHYEYFPNLKLIRFYGLFHGAENPLKWSSRK